MSYATITKSNSLYQPRENIKTLIQNNLTYTDIQIYSYFPNQKANNFKGYPFIVIPELDNNLDEVKLGYGVKTYLNEVDGTIYHEVKSLGDNKLRTTKQNIFEAVNKKSNEQLLCSYNMQELSVEFDSSSSEPSLVDQNEIIELPFSITFNVEVNFG